MNFVMLTNILNQATLLLCVGSGSGQLVDTAFSVQSEKLGEEECFTVLLPGVVSRKKQMIPPLSLYAEQL